MVLLKSCIMKIFKENWLKLLIFIICLGLGLAFAKIYQTPSKTSRIYKQALKDYENKNYSNSYYLFSKVGYSSRLKPFAIYRQAMCAKLLGDKKSELNAYQRLFNYYPKHQFSPEAKYQAGQLLVEEDPALALKYFKTVDKSHLDRDYKIAANYYKARIAANQARYQHKKLSKSEQKQIENFFREYLESAPDGRLALAVAQSWEKFNQKPSPQDNLSIAKAYYNSSMFDKAKNILDNLPLNISWAVRVSNAVKLRDFDESKKLMAQGVENFADTVPAKDYNNALNDYLGQYDKKSKSENINDLYSKAKGKNRAYLLYLKCENSSSPAKTDCYRSLYTTFPSSAYAQESLMKVFRAELKSKNYSKCSQLAQDFQSRYPNSSYSPYILFWTAKIAQGHGISGYAENYQRIINMYPDSYYAYRAFWITKGLRAATIDTPIKYKPVLYPYRYPTKDETLYYILQVKDYTLASKYAKDDFIDSWIEHEKGNYTQSINIAKKAMDSLSQKPPKADLRWRLVYPLNYYKQLKFYADEYKNNDALMMGIIRTESTFNPEAQSNAGAIGLMQLMPATAHDIGNKNGITFNTSYLFNPELNIKIGNLYFSTIHKMLDKKDVSAVAAYNGGIGSVMNWKTSLKYNDTDEFVEQIPYEETRDYVERVFESYWNYIRIYQRQ